MAEYTPNFNLSMPEQTDTQASFIEAYRENMGIIDDNLGGGGSAEIVEMTQAEYDALPDTKLTDGVLRAIKDEYSPADSKLVGLGDCYSTSEKQIGCWVSGKPLYQKTFVYDTTQSSGQITLSTGLLDVDEIISFSGVASYPSDGVNIKWIPLPFSCDSNGYAVGSSILKINSFLKTTGEISAYIGADYQSSYAINRIRITLRYTKNTDTAGSGTWTPEGVPAHHYSTTEQVIGTWIDGKPLYERSKVVPFANFTHHNDIYFTSIVDDNTETIRNVEAIAYTSIYGTCSLGSRAYSRDDSLAYYWEVVQYYSSLALHFIGDSASTIGVTDVVITYQYTKTTD